MPTLTGTRGTTTFPASGFGPAGNMKVAWGSYTLAANPTAADVIRFCKVPANAIVLGGYLQGADIDTGTEEMVIDIGWLANGVENANTAGFLDADVMTGDAITGIKPEVGIYYPFGGVLFTTGPQKFSAETVIAGLVNVDAHGGGTGILTCVVFYVLDY